MKFSERLKEALKWQNISQKDLSIALGVTKSAVNKWIKVVSFPTLETFYRLCIILREESDYLLGLKN